MHDLVMPGEIGALVKTRAPQGFVAPIAQALANRAAYDNRTRELAAQYSPGHILARLCQ